MAYVFAHAFSPADFAHGPFAVLDEGFAVLATVAEGPVASDSLDILRRAQSETAASGLVLTNVDTPGLRSARLPAIPEFLPTMVFITAAQLFTLHTALLRGVDPETPRGLEKVTRTK